jgi:lipopolysaccharide/colanic/teichoic acid biosynthesis glycosyltransferase
LIKLIKAFEKTMLSLTKLFLIVLLYLVFYGFYVFDSPELQRFSRVSTIITSTFLILCYAMIRLFGNYSIGGKKSKELILSVIMGAVITDFFTYGQLCIMEKRIMRLYPLAFICAVQLLAAIIITRQANRLFSAVNPPKKLIVISRSRARPADFMKKLQQYQHKYELTKISPFEAGTWKNDLENADGALVSDIEHEHRQKIIEYCYNKGKSVLFEPGLCDIIVNSSTHELLDDSSLFVSPSSGLSFEQRFVKRAFDIVVSLAGIILLSPVMLLEAAVIKLYDGGNIFYLQERCTIGGKRFRVIKFRTMIENAESLTGAVLSVSGDSRITRAGRVFRALRLDELPQLFNVLSGSMSIVGPRPEREELANDIKKELPEFEYRLRVKAGLTGLAQTAAKYSTSPKDKLVLDLLYIEKYSIKLDIKIFLQTLLVILSPEKSE